MAWILRLVETGAKGERQAQDVMEIDRPGGLGDIAALGLTLPENETVVGGASAGNRRGALHPAANLLAL